MLLEKAGDAEGARRRFEEAAALNPEFALPWTNLAEMASRAGDHEGAVRACGEAIARKPGEPAFHYNLARYLAAAGRRDDAIAEYRAVLDLKPEDARAWNKPRPPARRERQHGGGRAMLPQGPRTRPRLHPGPRQSRQPAHGHRRFDEGVAVYEEGVASTPPTPNS